MGCFGATHMGSVACYILVRYLTWVTFWINKFPTATYSPVWDIIWGWKTNGTYGCHLSSLFLLLLFPSSVISAKLHPGTPTSGYYLSVNMAMDNSP